MTIKVAINGFGRIGRNITRALYESSRTNQISIVAVNDLADKATNAHLLQYDSVHGRFGESVELTENGFLVNGDPILTLSERNPAALPWKQLEVDVVLECTGLFTSKAKAEPHLKAGAKKSHSFSARRKRRGCNRGVRSKPRHYQIVSYSDFQCFVYDQLPGADLESVE